MFVYIPPHATYSKTENYGKKPLPHLVYKRGKTHTVCFLKAYV